MSAQLQEVLHIFAGITSRNNDNGLVSTQKSKEGNNNKTEPQSQKPKGNNNYFPLHKLLDGMKSETTSQKAFKELSTMALNLIPAAIVTESLDSIGEFFQVENFFDSISPIATQFSRYATIDGITKKNIYKPILESISALALFVIKRTTNISSAFLRPFSAVFFYGIEMFDEMKSLVIANNNENKKKITRKISN